MYNVGQSKHPAREILRSIIGQKRTLTSDKDDPRHWLLDALWRAHYFLPTKL